MRFSPGCGALLLLASSVTLLLLLVHPTTTAASAQAEDLVAENTSQDIPLAAAPLNAPESLTREKLDVDDGRAASPLPGFLRAPPAPRARSHLI